MRKPVKRYDAQFKRDAVELLLTSGKSINRLAVELGVADVTLRNWRDRHLAKTEPIETKGKKLSGHQLAQELRRVGKLWCWESSGGKLWCRQRKRYIGGKLWCRQRKRYICMRLSKK